MTDEFTKSIFMLTDFDVNVILLMVFMNLCRILFQGIKWKFFTNKYILNITVNIWLICYVC
jgi:hypothetical protein